MDDGVGNSIRNGTHPVNGVHHPLGRKNLVEKNNNIRGNE